MVLVKLLQVLKLILYLNFFTYLKKNYIKTLPLSFGTQRFNNKSIVQLRVTSRHQDRSFYLNNIYFLRRENKRDDFYSTWKITQQLNNNNSRYENTI